MTPGAAGKPRERILARLLAAGGWLSGEAISEELGISRAAVAKHINVLRSSGHEIEAAPRRGYRLLAEAEDFSGEALQAVLATRVFGQKRLWLTEAASTNSEAVLQALSGAASGLLVVAQRQSAGRGRQGHTWFSAPESLAFSLLLRPEGSIDVQDLTQKALMAVCRALSEEAGVHAQIKQPNDLLLNGRKLAGTLVEAGYRAEALEWVVLGVGLNVNAPASVFSGGLEEIATSLRIETGQRFSRIRILARFLAELERLIEEVEVVGS